MSARTLAAIACLVVGVGLEAWSFTYGHWLFAGIGFALICTFVYLAYEAMNKAGKPKHQIKPAANSAWSMKDEPSKSRDGHGSER